MRTFFALLLAFSLSQTASAVLGDPTNAGVYQAWIDRFQKDRAKITEEIRARGWDDPEQVVGTLFNEAYLLNQYQRYDRGLKDKPPVETYASYFAQDPAQLDAERRRARQYLLELFIDEMLEAKPSLDKVEAIQKTILSPRPDGKALRHKMARHIMANTTDPKQFYWQFAEVLTPGAKLAPLTSQEVADLLFQFSEKVPLHEKKSRREFESLVERLDGTHDRKEVMVLLGRRLLADSSPMRQEKLRKFIDGYNSESIGDSTFSVTRLRTIAPFLDQLDQGLAAAGCPRDLSKMKVAR